MSGHHINRASREKTKFVHKRQSLSTLFHFSENGANKISTLSWLYFLESLFFMEQGTILFLSRKQYLVLFFITNMRRPHIFITEKTFFFYFTLLADWVIHTLNTALSKSFFLKLRPFVSGFAPFLEQFSD